MAGGVDPKLRKIFILGDPWGFGLIYGVKLLPGSMKVFGVFLCFLLIGDVCSEICLAGQYCDSEWGK